MTTAQELIEQLGLQPHVEGGYFVETYRSELELPGGGGGRGGGCVLPAGYGGARSIATAIYYLVTPESFSTLHRVRGDEMFHFYLGDPVEMLVLFPDGGGEVLALGQDVAAGMRPQAIVPGGCWQGSRLLGEGRFALLGATMAPGFDYEDFELAEREPLARAYPDFRERITALTK